MGLAVTIEEVTCVVGLQTVLPVASLVRRDGRRLLQPDRGQSGRLQLIGSVERLPPLLRLELREGVQRPSRRTPKGTPWLFRRDPPPFVILSERRECAATRVLGGKQSREKIFDIKEDICYGVPSVADQRGRLLFW